NASYLLASRSVPIPHTCLDPLMAITSSTPYLLDPFKMQAGSSKFISLALAHHNCMHLNRFEYVIRAWTSSWLLLPAHHTFMDPFMMQVKEKRWGYSLHMQPTTSQ
ncbi:hypothetical protein GOP47_0002211, partial [Adiantum capillus-veneris]